MVTLICPWCETDIAVDLALVDGDLTCPECSTCCRLAEETREVELAPAA
jgi:hypothetical protein